MVVKWDALTGMVDRFVVWSLCHFSPVLPMVSSVVFLVQSRYSITMFEDSQSSQGQEEKPLGMYLHELLT